MKKAKAKEVKQWLIKSQRDLDSARLLLKGGYLDTAVYHCQQAVEKAIKAYLTYRDVPFEKTHNLVALLAFCVPLEPSFEQWRETQRYSLRTLQSFAIQVMMFWSRKQVRQKKRLLAQKLW
ncbi:MAG: hypothetical protein PWP42_1031 [Candidatus Atribacteria bacterium]|nr:hypothetical protein [Candidatus Atribacteria bacterium]